MPRDRYTLATRGGHAYEARHREHTCPHANVNTYAARVPVVCSIARVNKFVHVRGGDVALCFGDAGLDAEHVVAVTERDAPQVVGDVAGGSSMCSGGELWEREQRDSNSAR